MAQYLVDTNILLRFLDPFSQSMGQSSRVSPVSSSTTS